VQARPLTLLAEAAVLAVLLALAVAACGLVRAGVVLP
jgi:hypothetical protein